MASCSSEYPLRIPESRIANDSAPLTRTGRWKLPRRGFLIGLILLAVEPPTASAFAGAAAGPYGIPYSDTY